MGGKRNLSGLEPQKTLGSSFSGWGNSMAVSTPAQQPSHRTQRARSSSPSGVPCREFGVLYNNGHETSSSLFFFIIFPFFFFLSSLAICAGTRLRLKRYSNPREREIYDTENSAVSITIPFFSLISHHIANITYLFIYLHRPTLCMYILLVSTALESNNSFFSPLKSKMKI